MKRPRSRRGRRRPSSERKIAREIQRRRTRAAAPKGGRRIGASPEGGEPTMSGIARKLGLKGLSFMPGRGGK